MKSKEYQIEVTYYKVCECSDEVCETIRVETLTIFTQANDKLTLKMLNQPPQNKCLEYNGYKQVNFPTKVKHMLAWTFVCFAHTT